MQAKRFLTRPAIHAAIFIALLSHLAAGCGELNELPTAPGTAPDPNATFSRVQNEIFTPSCTLAGCHDTAGRQQNLVLSAGQAYSMIVRRPSTQVPSLHRVQPGEPLTSYLFMKVTGGTIVGEKMPPGSSLSDAQIRLIRDWIQRGAPND